MKHGPLKKYEIKESDKEKIIAIISALFPKAKIYLFGSRAVETAARGSDIDLALDTGTEIDYVALGELRDVLNETHIPQKIDIVDFNSPFLSSDMKESIIRERIVWKN